MFGVAVARWSSSALARSSRSPRGSSRTAVRKPAPTGERKASSRGPAEFGGRQPLLEMRDGGPRYTDGRARRAVDARPRRSRRSTSSSGTPTRTAGACRVPFWLLRMKSDADSVRRLRLRASTKRRQPASRGHREVRPGHHPRSGDTLRRARPPLGTIDQIAQSGLQLPVIAD